MVHPERLELPTHRFVADCSVPLSYGCIWFISEMVQWPGSCIEFDNLQRI